MLFEPDLNFAFFAPESPLEAVFAGYLLGGLTQRTIGTAGQRGGCPRLSIAEPQGEACFWLGNLHTIDF